MTTRATIIGIGELAAAGQADAPLKTYALGSCLAIIMLAPKTRTVGMAHVALSDSAMDAKKAKQMPGYFVDTAITALLQEMSKFGCSQNGDDILVKLVGGANILAQHDLFNIGSRNISAAKKCLQARNLRIIADNTGGNISRTVMVSTQTGEVWVSSPGKQDRKV